MSRLKTLLRVAGPSTRNTQQDSVQACKPVAQHVHTTQQQAASPAGEFKLLLAAVGPIYDTPAEQYAIIRATATGDLPAALECFRSLAERHGVTIH